MNEDMTAAVNILNIKAEPQWGNGGNKKKESLQKYYKQLTEQQIQELQTLYNYDFEIFDFKKTVPE